MAKSLTISKLNELYSDAESVDSRHFSEQRTNVKLVAGKHYSNLSKKLLRRVRDNNTLTSEQKIRIVKNHIQKITKIYRNNIAQHSPGATILPKNEKELQDQKAAELHLSIWQDIKEDNNFENNVLRSAQDYVELGEVANKIGFDEHDGEIIGYEQVVDESGFPVFNPETGEPEVDTKKPVKAGKVKIERIFGFNLLRDPSAKSADEFKFVILRKMVDIEEAKMLTNDVEKQEKMTPSHDKTYRVFNTNTGSYEKSNKIEIREYYYRPSKQYPEGYFYIATDTVKLQEGVLPGSIYPIVFETFDEIATQARGVSIIRHLRPYQIEINRMSSKIAEHQVTIGDDKLISHAGSSIAHGGQLNGVRLLQVSGAPPQVLPGRTGEQYLASLLREIDEMYKISDIDRDDQEKFNNVDAYAMLYSRLREKKKFVIYSTKFENFIKKTCEVSLKIAKLYYEDYKTVPVIGRHEAVNISEFKNSQDLGFQITVEPMSEDAESMMGKQLSINHLLQFVGNTMGKEDIGQLARSLPFLNKEGILEDLTIDVDNIKNDILSMDRGVFVEARKYDNHEYIIKKLINRIKSPDFPLLDAQIQESYNIKVDQHEQLFSDQQKQLLEAQQGLIPTGGYMVKVDFYVTKEDGSGTTRRASVPYESINWLLDRLKRQGAFIEQMDELPEESQVDMIGTTQGGSSGSGETGNF